MKNNKLIFICGLCVIEDEQTTLKVAKFLKKETSKYPEINFYFKSSYDKANRTSIKSFRGLGFERGMKILKRIKKDLNIKILTDVHTVEQAEEISKEKIIDVVQLPAFLCRQTNLVVALAKTGKIVNIKKGQFLAPEDMLYVINKVKSTGNDKIFLTERGVTFGYHNLVVDFRSFLIMKKFGYPVIFDATHSQQLPSLEKETGGNREFIIPMAKAAVACGVDGLFVECHPEPSKAKCDSTTSLSLKDVEILLKEIERIRE